MQNSHSLRNFDLSEYRAILNDLAVWLYQGLVKIAKELVHPLIGRVHYDAHPLLC